MLNNNRFLVVTHDGDNNTKLDLGTSIVIQGHKFNIVYEGMQKHCYLCNRKHGRECPKKVRFEFLKKMRKGKTDKRKIYSDSSLRQVNQLSLTSDVACMSGAGIGQLCNIIPLDNKHEEVVIHAGNNEIAQSGSLNEFVYTVNKETEKLRALANDTKVTLIL